MDELSSAPPTCEEVNSYPNSFFCTEECATEYWQCINGEVLKRNMPEGTFCLNGEFDAVGTCSVRDDRCDAIEALNLDGKIMCTDDCSDTYLACSNGVVIERPMAEGTKCYRDGIVHTDAGHCVVQEEVVTYFELMDACKNYPDLEHCASTTDPSTPPYIGAEFHDDAWYFVDKVWFSYISTFSHEYGKGWDVFININFGHDRELGRTRSYIARMDYGTTEIYQWSQYDLIDGEDAHYNCKTDVPDEPITKLIAQIIKNPAVIFELGQGTLDIPDDDEVHDYTAQVNVSASEVGLDGDDMVNVLAESVDAADEETPAEAEPVTTPTFLFKNVTVYVDDDSTEDNGEDVIEEDEVEEEGVELIEDDSTLNMEEVRNLLHGYFGAILNETICNEDLVYDNENDVAAPILNRGELTAGTGEDDNGSDEINIINGTEALSDQLKPNDELLDPISRRLKQLNAKNDLKAIIPQDTIYDCNEGEILVHHCCSEDEHFIACSPNEEGECPSDATPSARCLEPEFSKDIIVEPHYLKGNVPMQLHTADHLENLEYDLDNNQIFTEESVSELLEKSIRRKMYWDEEDTDEWVPQEEEDFTSDEKFLPQTRGNLTKWINNPIANDTDVTAEDLYDNFGDLFLGRGGGLPNVREVLDDLNDLDTTLLSFYEFNTALEGDMLSIFDLMKSIEEAHQKLKSVDTTLVQLDRVLRLVSIIKSIKPIVIPVRNAVRNTRKYGILPGLKQVKKIRDTVTSKYKPKVKKALTQNEEIRGALAKSRFVNQNLLINPFETTRNCQPSDTAAGIIAPVVDYVNRDTSEALEQIEEFRHTLKNLVADLSGVFNLVNEMVDTLDDMKSVTNPIASAMNPFYKALSTRITVPIVGPFCRKTVNINVRYPCGVKRCKKCRRIFRRRRCIRYACGVKKCTFRKRVRLPVFCKKKFTFTVDQVLKGISGVMDIIFYPINKAVDELMNAIPLPDIPLLPEFPANFNALDQIAEIGDVFDGPSFPSELLDVANLQLALPGIDNLICGKSSEDVMEIFELTKNGELTPDVVRDFYDGCGGMQDLNPVCETTQELLCGDGGCP